MQLNQLKILLTCKVDEMWSFVRGKKLQRWFWYDWELSIKRIIAHAFGDRSTNTLNILLRRMENFNVALWCTDNFSAYNIIPNDSTLLAKCTLSVLKERI